MVADTENQKMTHSENIYAVLLRGVMPTGRNRVPMAQLREVLLNAGFTNVRTYIQSGNVVLGTKLSAKETEEKVQELIKTHIGADLTVVVRTSEQLQRVLEENPFGSDYDESRMFFVLFSEPPSTEKTKALMNQDYGDEKLVIGDSAGYMYIPGNAARSKLSNVMLEKKLGIAATTRNLNTMKKMVEWSGE